MSEEEIFFYQLLKKTKIEYLKSPLYQKYGVNQNWYYAICDTPIMKGKGIVCGLNWGGRKHSIQTAYPTVKYERNWTFAKHANKYFNKHFKVGLDSINYSNICFFRTPKITYLSYADWQITIPLFKEYLDFINPPWVVMFGSPKILNSHQLTNRVKFVYKGRNDKRNSFAHIGLLFGKYPFGSVPHSAARCSPETHETLWERMHNELQIQIENNPHTKNKFFVS